MRLMLVDDDGNVIERWSIEDDFGDLTKKLPQDEMVSLVVEALERHNREVGK